MKRISWIVALWLAALPAMAQNYTTAAEVKPILAATKANWIAVRAYDGQDLLYFTNLLAWRCGVDAVAYGINGAAPETALQMEPCYASEAAPNMLKMDQGVEIYVALPLDLVQSVSVLVTYDDGSTEVSEFQRAAVLSP